MEAKNSKTKQAGKEIHRENVLHSLMVFAYDGIRSFKPILYQNAMNVINPKTSQLSNPLIIVCEMPVLVII